TLAVGHQGRRRVRHSDDEVTARLGHFVARRGGIGFLRIGIRSRGRSWLRAWRRGGMALVVRVDGRASWRLAALGLAFAVGGCGEQVNNSLWDRIAAGPSDAMPARAPEIVPTAQAMSGRWTLTMPGTGACGMTFGPAAAEGSIALDGTC